MGYVGLEEDYYVSVKSVLDITAETGALTTQSRIRELTPADVEPVVYGRWVYVDDDDMLYDTYYCSECHNRITVDSHRRDDIGFTIDDMKRCNRCGAKMDAQGEE